jgi:hypothetical protein
MRVARTRVGLDDFLLCALILCAGSVIAQNVYTPPPHVIIPNPTPRPPDLNQQFGDNPADQKKREMASIQNQLRAREIWLESNQILLLAQQLQQEVHPSKKAPSMAANAVKVGQIEKLAQSVQQKMKTR